MLILVKKKKANSNNRIVTLSYECTDFPKLSYQDEDNTKNYMELNKCTKM